jgi:hypothetical protein
MRTLFCVLAGLLFIGCGSLDATQDRFAIEDAVPIDRETGKPLLGAQARHVGLEAQGPRTAGLQSRTEVWNVSRRWYQTDPAPGMAWPAESGLTWDEKYSAWVDSMDQIMGDDGEMTVELITPLGQRIPSPRLECAEMAMFLRTVFAAWYELPFFLTAYHPSYGDIHMGHFGIVRGDGSPVPGYPNYATRYPDETHRGVAALDAWPSDYDLAARKLTQLADDYNLWMGEDKYAGAYFDHILLNKRVGHFLHVLLTSAGSMHLAYSQNMFDLKGDAMREGDVLVHRWQAQGIGHVMVVKEVDWDGDQMSAEIMFGSMPRIQPEWYDADQSRYYFLSQNGGGAEISGDGVAYSALGGGLKRWRTPVVKDGRWLNIVPVRDREDRIDGNDTGALEQRLEDLELLFGALSDDDRIAQLAGQIELARDNLRNRPASCANRIRREEAFDDLYAMLENKGWTREEVDAEYRLPEDYVFAELAYDESKTCCWNQTTPDMFDIIMDFNADRIASAGSNECMDPVVFKARNGGYDLFRNFAVATGRGDLWNDWSADETCPQADTIDDVEANAPYTDFCDLPADSGSTPVVEDDDPCGGITWEGQCDGDTLSYCDDETVHVIECDPNSCGYDADMSYYNCL